MACPGHRPHAQPRPLPKIIRGDGQSWGSPWREGPTRQEPALLSNHDGAAAPGPARLCNDLKQESRVTGPHILSNMGHKSEGETREARPWNLEPGNLEPASQPHLNSRFFDPSTILPSTAESRSSPSLTSPRGAD